MSEWASNRTGLPTVLKFTSKLLTHSACEHRVFSTPLTRIASNRPAALEFLPLFRPQADLLPFAILFVVINCSIFLTLDSIFLELTQQGSRCFQRQQCVAQIGRASCRER